jgi:hypothetical protein
MWGSVKDSNHGTGRITQKPSYDNDEDWSSSGPEWGAKNDTEQLSEHSDKLSEALSDVREPDEDHTGLLSQTVHMACIWEVHHYQVDRDLDDREPHPENEDDYGDYQLRDGSTSPMLFEDRDGQLWSYDGEIIPCNDAQECGQNCESPVERHWVESEVPDWVQDSDGNSPECEGEDNKDDFEEESEAEEDPFVDKLKLEVKIW